jgi:hypothetical protein
MADDPAAYLAAVRARLDAGRRYRQVRETLTGPAAAAMDEALRWLDAGAGPPPSERDWPPEAAEAWAELSAAHARVLDLWRQMAPDRRAGLAPPRGAAHSP